MNLYWFLMVMMGVNHTIEGPKFYKRNGYYYILAPAGGVVTGWQLALRSRNVYGPYESKIVMAQGDTDINGPHQGGWVGNLYRRVLVYQFSKIKLCMVEFCT